jgi:hypothetical protein
VHGFSRIAARGLALGSMLAISTAPARAEAQHGSGPLNRADYALRARIAGPRTLEGEARIRWTHQSETPVRGLYWHLYANAFSEGSLFLRTLSGESHRGNTPGQRGAITLHALSLSTGEDLLARAVTDFNEAPGDRTQLYTPLPRTIPKDTVVELVARFTVTLPDALARSGCGADFCFAGQWFPKLAVLERDGRWASFALHAQSEFYADFGRYDLEVDAPADAQVFATGTPVGADRVSAGRRLASFHLGRAHDAAFGWSSRFTLRQATAGTASPRDGEPHEGPAPSAAVAVRAYSAPEDALTAERAVALVQRALPALERRYGPYPYATLTLVVAPHAARGVGGMEYPSLITVEAHPLLPPWVRYIEYVTAHELAHQWFYGLLASDERSHPVLDEGLTEFATGQVLVERYGPHALAELGSSGLGFWALQGAASSADEDDGPLARPAASFANFGTYADLVYRRAAALFATVERDAPDALARALGRYARAQRFRHPTPADLLEHLSSETSLSDVTERLVRPSLELGSRLDLAIESLSAQRATLVRRGALAPRVAVLIERDDGSVDRRAWDTRALPRWTLPGPLRSVRIDPDAALPLEGPRADNARTVHPPGLLPFSARVSTWIALALRWLGP